MANGFSLSVHVDGKPIDVTSAHPTVQQILTAVGLSSDEVILIKHEGEAERTFEDPDETVPLSGGEQLATRTRTYRIIVNGRERTVDSRVVTYEQVIALAPNLPPPGEGVQYSVTFTHAFKPHEGDLIAGEHVTVKNGTQFVVSSSNRS